MVRRILIIRLSALGDILHTLPALAALRASFPKSHIGWLVQDSGAQLLTGHPMLDAVHIFPRRALRENRWAALRGPVRDLIREVRAQKYSVAIDFQGLTKSAIWAFLSGAPTRIGFDKSEAREISRVFYNQAVRPQDEHVHVIERNLDLLGALQIASPEITFPVHIPVEAKATSDQIWGAEDGSRLRVVLNPGAGWKTKQWPASNYGMLAKLLVEKVGARVAVAWGPGEEELVQAALGSFSGPSADAAFDAQSAAVGSRPGCYALPRTSFVELGGVISKAQLFVGGDTGPTHFAAALGVPVVGIYGASDAKRNGPWGEMAEIIQLTEPPCIPCWKTQCAWHEPLACLTHIRVHDVFERCLKMIEMVKLPVQP